MSELILRHILGKPGLGRPATIHLFNSNEPEPGSSGYPAPVLGATRPEAMASDEKLTAKQKELLHQRILKLDPKSELVKIEPDSSYTSGSISYNVKSGIVLNEKIDRK